MLSRTRSEKKSKVAFKVNRSQPRQNSQDLGQHPDHMTHIKRINRVKGQLEGIERMIRERRYCPDIITQLKAASAALKAVEAEVFKSHLSGCVRSAFSGEDALQSEVKIQEIIKMFY